MEHLVIIGHGMAAQRFLQTLTDSDASQRQITVIGDEPVPAYNRILLSPCLAGEASLDSISLNAGEWYQQRGIRRHSGDPVITVDRTQQTVITAAGHRFHYDRLVFATGARPTSPSWPGADLNGIMAFRTMADTRTLMSQAEHGAHAVVVGGGFLGLEAGEGLRKQGMTVTLLHRSGHLLNRQLDPHAGALLRDTLRERGLTIHLETEVAAFTGDDRVNAVTTKAGETLKADLVVIATGIAPNRELAEAAQLDCAKGIQVNGYLTTADPRVHAIGECCEVDGETFGLVEPVHQQADTLARHLNNDSVAPYTPGLTATRLKISGINLFSCGQVTTDETTESIVYEDRLHGEYRHLLLRDNRLVGAVLYGDTAMGPWLFDHLENATDLSPFRAQLAFGEAHCDVA